MNKWKKLEEKINEWNKWMKEIEDKINQGKNWMKEKWRENKGMKQMNERNLKKK